MNQFNKTGPDQIEEVFNQMGQIEQSLMKENPTLAVDLMILEVRFRDAFKKLEDRLWDTYCAINTEDEPLEGSPRVDWFGIIPQDVKPPSLKERVFSAIRFSFPQHSGGAVLEAAAVTIGVISAGWIFNVILRWIF